MLHIWTIQLLPYFPLLTTTHACLGIVNSIISITKFALAFRKKE